MRKACDHFDYGDELVSTSTHMMQVFEGPPHGQWHVLLSLATELSADMPNYLLQAERVTRVRDARGDNYVAWFPTRLKGTLAGAIPGREDDIKDGARSIWYSVAKYGPREAEVMAKRHLKRAEDRSTLWARVRGDVIEPREPAGVGVRRRLAGKQSAEGRRTLAAAAGPLPENEPQLSENVRS